MEKRKKVFAAHAALFPLSTFACYYTISCGNDTIAAGHQPVQDALRLPVSSIGSVI